ncbi:hypothetical protein BN77_1491 [Rhizobium mesoamericanum STM3625]|uniref:Uncharacterized protein n=1 Tax=Rhizobium mesoamericanum STM3625 TaxID=1211777 RepID=K0PT91_9HYPH|nr:hypothetical protein BN77_1491 [Rhizobium mesoamericanum STM3625]
MVRVRSVVQSHSAAPVFLNEIREIWPPDGVRETTRNSMFAFHPLNANSADKFQYEIYQAHACFSEPLTTKLGLFPRVSLARLVAFRSAWNW